MSKKQLPKLIPGKMNVPYIKCKAGKAIGAKLAKGYKGLKDRQAAVVPFNAPTLILRKAA